MASVKQNRWALKDASEDIQGDREIVMAAVK